MFDLIYTLVPGDIGNYNAFSSKKDRGKGCQARREYERWARISRRASANGVEMDKYHTMMYGYRCPLVRKVSVIGSAKM